MNSKVPTIYVVDDDPSVCRSLARLLGTANYQVEVFSSAQDFLDLEHHQQPCCLILDVSMPGVNGLEVQENLVSRFFNIPIIFVTGFGTIPMSVKAMKKGAVSFLEKPFDKSELLQEIGKAIQLNTRVADEESEISSIKRRVDLLTLREKEVFELVVKGYLNKQIAAQLNVCEKTIKAHRAKVMHKMQVKSLAELVHLNEIISSHPRSSKAQPYRK